jgi:hypothetical protein
MATSASASGPFEPQFTRAQLEWALWRRVFGNRPTKPTAEFKTNIKNLLEFDRGAFLARSQCFAFADAHPSGQGEFRLFSVFDAVCLDLALSLLRMGVRRKETVLLLRQQRAALREQINSPLNECFRAALASSHVDDPDEATRELPWLVWALVHKHDGEPPQATLCEGFQSTHKIVREIPQSHHVLLLDIAPGCGLLSWLLLRAAHARGGRRPT